MSRYFASALAGLIFASVAGAANAGVVPYPTPGVQNPVLYSFVATGTGDVTAYFAGSSAGFNQDISMLVNGVSTGIFGLNNHTSVIGQSLVLGSVTAGDIITFVDRVNSTGNFFYSDVALNSDGINHVYSTSVTAGQISALIPAGTYIGFEDILRGGDLDYNDVQFVVTIPSGVPEPSTWAMMLIGFAGLGYAARRRRQAAAA